MDQKRRIHPEVRRMARELRKVQTPAEQKMWRALRKRQLDGHKFRRQHPIGRYIVDFYCPACKLAIEIDGDVHAMQEEYDAIRAAWLFEQGYYVIRFTNEQVFEHFEEVMAEILYYCEKREVELRKNRAKRKSLNGE
jgi:very-short-patch-repair endonuclease